MPPCVYIQMANLAEADVSEEDKIKVMLNQSTYDAMKWVACVTILNFFVSIHLLFVYLHDMAPFTFFSHNSVYLPVLLFASFSSAASSYDSVSVSL